jgi:hypothetical protein
MIKVSKTIIIKRAPRGFFNPKNTMLHKALKSS